MFAGLSGAANEVHLQLVSVFWILLTPAIVVSIVLQFLKGRGEVPDPGEILRRVVVAVLMLLSFKFVIGSIAELSDALTSHISQDNSIWEFLEKLGPDQNKSESSAWFDFKNSFIYAISLLCYLVAYLGFFISEAIVAFVWSVLYALSPLLILCYVSKSTSSVTANLFKGLFIVSTWRILYACLGALLMNMELDKSAVGIDDWLLTAVVNLCIGLSMLAVPLFTKSLIGSGLSQAGTTLAAGATFAAGGFAKGFADMAARKGVNFAKYSTRPLTNPIVGNARLLKHQLNKRFEIGRRLKDANNRWQSMNYPDRDKQPEQQEQLNRNER